MFKVLNEVVVDRGPSSYLSNVDLFLDGHLITTVQGDGTQAETLCILGKYEHFSECLLGTGIISSSNSVLVVCCCAVYLLTATVCVCVRVVGVCSIRRDRFYANRKYSVRGGSRSVHDSSQRPRHHDHPYLPSLPLLSTHCGARWRGTQGTGDFVLGVQDLDKLVHMMP